MRFTARGADGETLESRVYYSVGGGAIVDEATVARNAPPGGGWDVPYNFHSGEELLAIAARERLTIAEVARANARGAMGDAEITNRPDPITRQEESRGGKERGRK